MDLRFLFAIITATLLFCGSANAGDAHMVNIGVKERYSNILLSASLKGAFTEKIEEAFMSGMPVTFTYYVNLIRHRTAWWDANEASMVVYKIVKYDSFAKEFNAIEVISPNTLDPEDFEKELAAVREAQGQKTLFGTPTPLPEKTLKRYLVLKDLPTLEVWMGELRDIPLGDKTDLPVNKKYYVAVKAEMDSIKLTPPFNYIFFFVSFLNFDTAWETSSPFIVESAEAPIQSMVGKKEDR